MKVEGNDMGGEAAYGVCRGSCFMIPNGTAGRSRSSGVGYEGGPRVCKVPNGM